jgi:hypothetical protein
MAAVVMSLHVIHIASLRDPGMLVDIAGVWPEVLEVDKSSDVALEGLC